jgi:N utilization substance protein B
MSVRHTTRQMAMQVLFLWDVAGDMDRPQAELAIREASDDSAARDRAIEMAAAAWLIRGDTDQWLERLAPQWPPRRQPGVDRSILRLATWELTKTQTPPIVTIDEAVELAKEFSTEQSSSFVNGVLDALLHEIQNTSAMPTSIDVSGPAIAPPLASVPSPVATSAQPPATSEPT